MLELITDIPSTIVGVKATGRIRKEDYKKVLLPALKDLYGRTGRVSLLLLIETKLRNYSIGAWTEDAKTGLRYFSKWHRVAIVSSRKGIKRFTNIFGSLVPGQYKGFMTEELEKAKDWVSA
jgi:hypothetical protein